MEKNIYWKDGYVKLKLITDYIWGDSELKTIKIDYDNISLSIFNENANIDIDIMCLQCFGMTEMIIWDDVIIDKISVYNAENHEIVSMLKRTFGTYIYDSEKTLDGIFYELKISMISGFSFSIICKDIVVKEA